MLVPSGTEGFTGLLVEGGRQGRFAGERLNQGQVGHPLLDGGGDPGIGRLGVCGRPLEARTEHPHDEEQWGTVASATAVSGRWMRAITTVMAITPAPAVRPVKMP